MTDDHQRYLDAAHAMQTGVAMTMEYEPKETQPKHLRVGVNAAMVEHSALAGLLIAKGLITEEEYLAALAKGMEDEADKYQTRVRKYLGPNVHLR